MLGLYKIEFKIFLRSKKFFILLFIFIFSAVTSTLFSYYLKEIVEMNSKSDIKVIIPTPSWETLSISYFKNISQLGLFILVFFISEVFKVDDKNSTGIYKSMIISDVRKHFIPKYILLVTVIVSICLVASLVSYYIIHSLIEDVNDYKLLFSYLFQTFDFITIAFITSYVVTISKSSLISTLSIFILILVLPVFNMFDNIKDFLPLQNLVPNIIKEDVYSLKTIFVDALIIGISILLSLKYKFRIKYKVKEIYDKHS